ncbi:hypothetical protein [Pseudonocardia abyssalis]|nr:hypothetical protein [Pseudonocardia abyssalis]
MSRMHRTVLAALIVLFTVAGCGAGGSNTDCGLDGCTVTFPRSGDASVSVLGISAQLVGVDAGAATIVVAGQTVTVPVGGETQVEGFAVGVESVTDTEVVVRVRPGAGG